MARRSQVAPPSNDTAETRPRADPLDQRSCCHIARRWEEFAGFTARLGSTSAFTNTVPPEVLQPAAKGVGPETSPGGGGSGVGGGVAVPPPPPPPPQEASAIAPARIRNVALRVAMPPPVLVDFPARDCGAARAGACRNLLRRERAGAGRRRIGANKKDWAHATSRETSEWVSSTASRTSCSPRRRNGPSSRARIPRPPSSWAATWLRSPASRCCAASWATPSSG